MDEIQLFNEIKRINKNNITSDQYESDSSFICSDNVSIGQICCLEAINGNLHLKKIESSKWSILHEYPNTINITNLKFTDHTHNYYIICGTLSGNIIMNGEKIELTENGSVDIFIAKYDKYGQNIFFKKMESIGEDNIKHMEIKNNKIYITGYFTNSITFGNMFLTSKFENSCDVFIACLSLENEEWIWAKSAHGNGLNYGNKIIIRNQYLYLTGTYNQQIYFEGSSENMNKKAQGQHIFIAKINISDGDIINVLSTANDLISESYIELNDSIYFENNIIISGTTQSSVLFGDKILELNQKKDQDIAHFLSIINLEDDNMKWKKINKINNRIIKIENYYDKLVSLTQNQIFTLDKNCYVIDSINLKNNFYYTDLFTNNHINIVGYDNNCRCNIVKFNSKFNEIYSEYFNFQFKIDNLYCNEYFFIINKRFIVRFYPDDRYDKCLVISKENGKNGEKIKVSFTGSTISGWNNLNIGAKYYIGDEGKLTTKSNNFPLGFAITNDKIVS